MEQLKGELKNFVVVCDDDSGAEIWTKEQYNIYISKALSYGACPAVRVVTTFDKEDSYFNQPAFDELKKQNQNLYEINKKVIDEYEEIKKQNQQLQEDYNIQEYKLSQCVKDNISLNDKITILQAEKEKLMSDYMSVQVDLQNKIFELEKQLGSRQKIVCFCGSLRFIEKFKEVEYQSVIDGIIALLPCCMFVGIQREYGAISDYKVKADELHKRKIDICNEVFVLNVGGYIGESTRSEINYTESIGKPITYLEPLLNIEK